ncbi:hypothetical protein KAV47_02175, partial [Candidatus Bathyarchaeota archaeon]|nr:hypothetical protein [Candidatus Bathyarchaeota archaeon]
YTNYSSFPRFLAVQYLLKPQWVNALLHGISVLGASKLHVEPLTSVIRAPPNLMGSSSVKVYKTVSRVPTA